MILVSILGDFHSSILPITYEFKEKISKHIIVYDDANGDVKQAKRILKGQKEFLATLSKESKDRYDIETIQIDEDSYESMLSCLERIKQVSTKYSDIYLNATDGLSSVAIILSSKLLYLGAKVIAYDRYDNTYNLHILQGMTKHPIVHNMDIKSHLILKGYKILNRTNPQIVNSRKSVILELTKDLINYKEFAQTVQRQPFNKVKGYDNYKNLLKSIGIKEQHFIQGTVFEEYIYHLIKDNFDFDDVWVGTKVEFEDEVENEFDILMIKDNHLHTIECKLVNGLNGEHFVYKTELIMDYLDDDGRAMILSVGGDNMRISRSGKKRFQFTKGDRARAEYGNIAIHQSKDFNEEDFLKDINEWFCN